MAAPSLVNSYHTVYNTTGASKSITNITTQAGDVVVVYGAIENNFDFMNTPSGNSISFTLQQSFDNDTNYSPVYMWTGVDSAGGSNWTLSTTVSGGSKQWGITCLVFRNASVGTSAITATGNVVPTKSITTTQANSAIVVLITDWDAVNAGTRTWQTVNSIAPSTGNGYEIDYTFSSGQYTMLGGYYPDAGSTGSKTVGLASPSPSDHFAVVAQEIKGTLSGSYTPIHYLRF
jgi:hypothetical protein